MPCVSSGRSSFAAPLGSSASSHSFSTFAFSSSVVNRRHDLSSRATSKHCSRPNTNTIAGTSPACASSRTVSISISSRNSCTSGTLRSRDSTSCHRHAPRELDPVAELLGVADRRRQHDELRARIEPDDRLLPHVAALGVVEVVALVHHDDVGRRDVLVGDDPVPQDLGDLDLDRRLAVDLVVAGREPDVALAEVGAQLAILLLGERAQRRRVDRALRCDETRAYSAAFAISVLPVPVGTVTSTLLPAKMAVIACSCTGYGSRSRLHRNSS